MTKISVDEFLNSEKFESAIQNLFDFKFTMEETTKCLKKYILNIYNEGRWDHYFESSNRQLEDFKMERKKLLGES